MSIISKIGLGTIGIATIAGMAFAYDSIKDQQERADFADRIESSIKNEMDKSCKDQANCAVWIRPVTTPSGEKTKPFVAYRYLDLENSITANPTLDDKGRKVTKLCALYTQSVTIDQESALQPNPAQAAEHSTDPRKELLEYLSDKIIDDTAIGSINAYPGRVLHQETICRFKPVVS